MMAEEQFTCPECASNQYWRDEVDIGVGTVYGPWRCDGCGWRDAGTDASEFLNNDCEDGCA